MKYLISTLLLSVTVFASQAKAVSEAAVLFLLIQPSVRANGMGGSSVASFDHGPQAIAFNPAHAGIAAFETSLAVEFYPGATNWLPQFNIEGLTYNAKSFFLGYNLGGRGKRSPVSLGVSYTRIDLNLGEQIVTTESGTILERFESSQNANTWSIAVGFDYLIKLGVGFSFKSINSNLSGLVSSTSVLPGLVGSASVNAYDFGLLLQVPVADIVSSVNGKPVKIGRHLSPVLTPAFGISKSNIGGMISFTGGSQEDPIPRVARIGISLRAGLNYADDSKAFPVASLEWSSEAEDLLVRRDLQERGRYESGFGLDLIDNVLTGSASQDVITRQGWELNLLDIITFRLGNYDDPDGLVFYDTEGYGISLSGFLRFLAETNPGIRDHSVLGFLSRHVDLEYHYARFDAGRGPLDDTTFDTVKISLH